MSIEHTSFIFWYKVFVFTIPCVSWVSGWVFIFYPFILHSVSLNTRYLFSTNLWLSSVSSWVFILYPFILPPLSLDTSHFSSKFLEYHRCPAESLSFILASGLFWHRSWLPPALFRQHPSHLPIFCLHRHQTKANTNTINYTHLLLPASIIWSKSITSHRLLSA